MQHSLTMFQLQIVQLFQSPRRNEQEADPAEVFMAAAVLGQSFGAFFEAYSAKVDSKGWTGRYSDFFASQIMSKRICRNEDVFLSHGGSANWVPLSTARPCNAPPCHKMDPRYPAGERCNVEVVLVFDQFTALLRWIRVSFRLLISLVLFC